MGHVAVHAVFGVSVIDRLVLATVNVFTKFEDSNFIRSEEIGSKGRPQKSLK